MTSYKVVVDKSTVPVGTADKVHQTIAAVLQQRGATVGFDVVSNPEFLKEGAAVADCMRPDRIIIGSYSETPLKLMRELYEPFNRNHDKIIFMDVRSAELTKYAANCMLATKISFMNEMANLAERMGADIEAVRRGIGSDPRIGYHFIYPGCGYGGSCFPKDVQALIRSAEELGYQPHILQAVEQVNLLQKQKLPTLVLNHFGTDLRGKLFAVWGASFKPNTDDMREAPSLDLMQKLWAHGARVQVFDPEAQQELKRLFPHEDRLILVETKEQALQGADALIICTEWQQFRAPDFDLIKQQLKQAVVFDGRNLYEPERMKQRGFHYYAIGRGDSVMLPASAAVAE